MLACLSLKQILLVPFRNISPTLSLPHSAFMCFTFKNSTSEHDHVVLIFLLLAYFIYAFISGVFLQKVGFLLL